MANHEVLENGARITAGLGVLAVITGCPISALIPPEQEVLRPEVGSGEIKKYPPAYKSYVPGAQCGGIISLNAGEQVVHIPSGCFAEISVLPIYECIGTFTSSSEAGERFAAEKPLIWDLKIDPRIEGSNSGTTTVKCTFVREETKSNQQPIILPSVTPQLHSEETYSGDKYSVRVAEITLPDDFNKLLDYYNGNPSDTDILQLPGETPIMNADGEFIGVSANDSKGNRIHYIRVPNPRDKENPIWSMVTINHYKSKEETPYGVPNHLSKSPKPDVAKRVSRKAIEGPKSPPTMRKI